MFHIKCIFILILCLPIMLLCLNLLIGFNSIKIQEIIHTKEKYDFVQQNMKFDLSMKYDIGYLNSKAKEYGMNSSL